MAGSSLQIDDDYCKKMGEYFFKEGQEIESFLAEYICILQRIKLTAIKKGDVSDALSKYIEYAGKIKGQINNISSSAKAQAAGFLSSVDNADQYLF